MHPGMHPGFGRHNRLANLALVTLACASACASEVRPSTDTTDDSSTNCPTDEECEEVCGRQQVLKCACDADIICDTDTGTETDDDTDQSDGDDDDWCLGAGAVAYYPFSGDARDHGAHGHHGTPMGAELTTDHLGHANAAYRFTSPGDTILLGDVFNDIDPPAAISIWVRPESLGHQFIFDSDDKFQVHSGLDLQVYQGKWAANFNNGGTGTPANRRTVVSSTDVVLNKWSHIVAVYGTDDDLRIYVDCEDVTGRIEGGANSFGATSSPARLGGTWNEFDFRGSVDELYVFDCAPTEEEVKRLCFVDPGF